MKNLFFAAMFLLAGMLSLNAQDRIIMKNGDEIEVKILEISLSEIRYKRFDNLEGPVVVISKSSVLVIVYENGTREVITATPYSNLSPEAQRAIDKRGLAFGLNWIGFGIGSYVQGDKKGGTVGLLWDLAAWTAIIAGTIPVQVDKDVDIGYGRTETITVLEQALLPVTYIGTAALLGSKIFQLIRPWKYADKFNVDVAVMPVFQNDGGYALMATASIKF